MKLVTVLLVVCACKGGNKVGRKEEPAGSGSGSAVAAPPATKDLGSLKISIGGAPIAMREAYIKPLPVAGRYQLFLTDKESSCHELLDNLFSKREGEQTLLFNLGQKIKPDGTLVPVVTDFFRPDSITIQPGSKAVVTGNAAKDSLATIALDVSIKGEKGDVEAHGTFPAKGCGEGEYDKSGRPKATHASSATLTIAGKQLPVVNAIRKGDDLVITTGPKDCSSTTPWAEVIVSRERGFWHAHGEWLEKEISNNEQPDPKTKDIKIKPGKKGTSDDGPTIELALSGAGRIEDYPIALAGTIEALDCPK